MQVCVGPIKELSKNFAITCSQLSLVTHYKIEKNKVLHEHFHHLGGPVVFYPHPVKETEVNLFSITDYEKETLLAPLHPHSHSGLSPSCHLLLHRMGREHKLE